MGDSALGEPGCGGPARGGFGEDLILGAQARGPAPGVPVPGVPVPGMPVPGVLVPGVVVTQGGQPRPLGEIKTEV